MSDPITAGPLTSGTEDIALRLAALVTLLSAALSLTFAGLIPGPVCLLTLGLVLTAGLLVPRWIPALVKDSRPRTTVALLAIGVLILVTAGSGSGALFSGGLSGPLGTAVIELGLPDGVPIGLFAALAAGALVAVSLELGDRRGVQSALVLGIAVLGLASVAAPGTELLPALVPGWPAAIFALTRLAAAATTAPSLQAARGIERSRQSGRPSPQGPRPQLMHRVVTTAASARDPQSQTITRAASTRALTRWQVFPVLAVISASLAALALAAASGVTKIGEHSNQSFGSESGLRASSAARSTSDYLGGEMDLTGRGSLSSEPALEVPTDSPRLWRAGTLDQYTGRGWLTTDPPGGLPSFVTGSGTAQLLDPTASDSPANSRTDRVRPLLWLRETQILAPGRLLSVASPDLGTRGSVLVAAGDRVTVVGGDGANPYQVRSQVLPTVDDPAAATTLTQQGSGTGSNDRQVDEALDPRWTVLPRTVPERVRLLGRTLVTGAPSRLEAVWAIEAELADRMTYNLDSPVPPRGADAVDDVLFVSHSGFCEQFATAEVVLLRAAGVPARIAVGFAGGEPGDDGFRTVSRADAHAWVEVWFPGVGWVTSDPTPAAAQSQAWWQPIWDALRSLLDEPAFWISAVLLLILVSVSVLMLLRRRSRPGLVDEPTGRTLDPDLAAAFARLEAALLAEGRPRAQNETVAALARRLSLQRQQNTLGRVSGPALADALHVLERALYAPQQPSRQECLAAASAIDQRDDPPSGEPTRSH